MPPKKKKAPIVVGTVSTRSTRRESIVNIQITPKTGGKYKKNKPFNHPEKSLDTSTPSKPKNAEILELLKDWSDEEDSLTSNQEIEQSRLDESNRDKQELIDILEGNNDDNKIVIDSEENTGSSMETMEEIIIETNVDDIDMKLDSENLSSGVVVEEQVVLDENEVVICEENSNNSGTEEVMETIIIKTIGVEDESVKETLNEIRDIKDNVNKVEGNVEEKMVIEDEKTEEDKQSEIETKALEEQVEKLQISQTDVSKNESDQFKNEIETKPDDIQIKSDKIEPKSDKNIKNQPIEDAEMKQIEEKVSKQEKPERRRGRSSNRLKTVEQEISEEEKNKNSNKNKVESPVICSFEENTSDGSSESKTSLRETSLIDVDAEQIQKILGITISDTKKLRLKKDKKEPEKKDTSSKESTSTSTKSEPKSTKSKRPYKKSSSQKVEIIKTKEPRNKSKKSEDSRRRSTRIKSISTSKKHTSGHGLVKSKSEPNISESTESTNITESEKQDSEKQEKPKLRSKSSTKQKSKSCEDLTIDSNSSSSVSQDSKSDTPPIIPSNGNRKSGRLPRVDPEITQRLKQFYHLKENLYKTDRQVCKEAKKMVCDCFMTEEEVKSGEFGCGEDCLNRLLMIECGNLCQVADRCTNKRFQKFQFAPVEVFKTDKKGLGLRAAANIPYGEFILEYVGEVLDPDEFDKRAEHYSEDKNIHYYFMSLRSDAIIDATMKGNISRFINHSCEPNAETQKWTVNGELRIGFFSTRTILAGEEITFDYRFQRYGKEAQKCLCETPSCRGWLGEQPDDDSEEEDEDEEEEEETDDSEAQNKSAVSPDKKSVCEVIGVPTSDVVEKALVDVESKAESIDTTILSDKETKETDVETKKTSPEVKKKVKSPKKKVRKELFEDVDQLEEEINMLVTTGLKNQAHTLKLSRLMVRSKDTTQRQKLLRVLRRGELPCRRLFLDYHGLRLMHGYMIDAQELILKDQKYETLRLELLQTLAVLPIQNKTMLQDSKVLPTVENWATGKSLTSPNSSESDTEKMVESDHNNTIISDQLEEIRFLANKLIEEWGSLKESFRIPKKERIEQMKEHEREANRKFMASSYAQEQDNSRKNDHRQNNRTWLRTKFDKETIKKNPDKPSAEFLKISKHERRKLFALQVELREEERRMKQREMWRQHELNCMMIGADPRFTAPFDPNRGFQYIWNPQMGQWQTLPIPTRADDVAGAMQGAQGVNPVAIPASVAPVAQASMVQVEEDASKVKFAGPIPPPVKLPPKWKCARDKYGRPYYYHIKLRKSQWEPPPLPEPEEADDSNSESGSSSDTSSLSSDTSSDKSDSEDEIDDTILLLEVRKQMEKSQQKVAKVEVPPKVEEEAPKVEPMEAEFSPDVKAEFSEEAEDEDTPPDVGAREPERLSSIDIRLKEQFDVRDDKPVLKKKRTGLCQEIQISPRTEEDRAQFREDLKRYRANKEKLKRQKLLLLEQGRKKKPEVSDSPVEDSSSGIMRRPRKDKIRTIMKSRIKEMGDWAGGEAKTIKETFRSNMATTVVGVLNAYRKPDCKEARITNTDDFKHLARKLTHFVMLKEMKHIDRIEDLICTDSVKGKAREYIRKYMSKFGEVYVKRPDEPDFKD